MQIQCHAITIQPVALEANKKNLIKQTQEKTQVISVRFMY